MMAKKVKFPKVLRGYKRQWLRCKTCLNVAYMDYLPYSFSNPLAYTPCGHGIGERSMGCEAIPEKEALRIILRKQLPKSK